MCSGSGISKKQPRGKPWKKGVSGNPSGRPKRTDEETNLIEACRQKTLEALAVIESLMRECSNPRVSLQAAQYIIERGHGKASERIELLDAREQGPQPGAEMTEQEAYLKLIKYKTYEEISAAVLDTEQTVEEGDYQLLELEG